MQPDIAGPFRKSSRSGPTNDCVEIAPTANNGMAIRDSKDRAAGIIRAGRGPWSALIADLKRT
ncbi:MULTISPECIES: DUF397 domain-containing protein [unclassified Embleya]|uniref:DUF397 domain-containing protein n=1 Tax=unclassified Embleya TaxID=2699296 RepID=UPI00340F0C4B